MCNLCIHCGLPVFGQIGICIHIYKSVINLYFRSSIFYLFCSNKLSLGFGRSFILVRTLMTSDKPEPKKDVIVSHN